MGDLRDDLAAAVKDFRRVWPWPHPLSANLALAVRAVAELDVVASREAAAVAAVARAGALADEWERDYHLDGQPDCPFAADLRRALDGAGDGMPNISGPLRGMTSPAWTVPGTSRARPHSTTGRWPRAEALHRERDKNPTRGGI